MKKLDTSYKLWIGFSLLLVAIWLFIVYLINIDYKKRHEIFKENEIKNFNLKINSTLDSFQTFTDSIYEVIINRKGVIDVIDKANSSSNGEREELQKKLYENLDSLYNELIKKQSSQFQFYLADGTSFFKFNKNERNQYLDIEVVGTPHLKKQVVRGFSQENEMGFKFVYPLYYKAKYIGAVKITIPIFHIIKTMSNLYRDSSFHFILNKEAYKKINNNFQFEVSSFSENYLSDKKIDNISIRNKNNTQKIKEYYIKNKYEVEKGLDSLLKFSLIAKGNTSDNYYITTFYPITGINKMNIGYFVEINLNSHIKDLYKKQYLVFVLSGLIVTTFITFGFIYIKERTYLKIISSTDYLTKLYNRNRFIEFANNEFEKGKRYNTPFIILLMDIDFFKRINDTYGHNTGDAILKSISKIILTQVRTTDIVARWGGEEFICLLPNTALTEGHIVANRIRNKIEKENFPKVGKVTLSIGVAENVGNYSTIEEIINNADIALYSSKQNGRNRVSLWQANNDIEI